MQQIYEILEFLVTLLFFLIVAALLIAGISETVKYLEMSNNINIKDF